MILGGKYAPYLGAVRVDSANGVEAPAEVWQATKNLSDMPSPVVYNGLVFMVTKDGIATCIDAQTGDYKWRRRIKGAYWASVTAAAGKIFFTNGNGTTTVVAAGPEYEELSSNELGESVYASMAISQGEIFVRTEENLICIAQEVRQ
jgi:outer membrane protein assembly factor BamB